MDLEGGDAVGGSGGRADLGGVIGEGGDVAPGQGALHGELGTGQLDAVARVAGEADDDLVTDFPAAQARAGGRGVPGAAALGAAARGAGGAIRTHVLRSSGL